MSTIKRIDIKYVLAENNCPVGTKSFFGKDADVLAANYQSAHPELTAVSFNVIRKNRRSRTST